MNHRRLISCGGWMLRRMCTAATEADPPEKKVSLYRRLSALEITGGSVSQTLNQYVMEGKAIGKRELVRCIEELRRYRKFQHAREILEWMAMRKINFSWKEYAMFVDLVFKTKGAVAAENYFSGLPPRGKNLYTHGALLNCYCMAKMEDKALAQFKKMDEFGCVTNLAMNNLMSLYMKLGQPEKVPPLVEDLKQRKIPMHPCTYNIWMHSLAKLNDLDGAERVYEEMKRVDADKIDWHTYCNLASMYVKAKQSEKAEAMLSMLEKEVEPKNRDAYHFLLYLYSANSNREEVYRVWNSLKSVSPVTNVSYLAMLRSLWKLNDMEGLTKCFEEWQSSCIVYDKRLAFIAIKCYLSQNRYEEAASILDEATRKTKGPVFQLHESFMNFFLGKGQLEDAVSHLEAVLTGEKSDEWRPSWGVVSAFMKYYEEKGLDGVEELRKIFKPYNKDDSWIRTYITPSNSMKEDPQQDHELESLEADVQSG